MYATVTADIQKNSCRISAQDGTTGIIQYSKETNSFDIIMDNGYQIKNIDIDVCILQIRFIFNGPETFAINLLGMIAEIEICKCGKGFAQTLRTRPLSTTGCGCICCRECESECG